MINEQKLDKLLLELGYDDFNRGTAYLREMVKRYTPGVKLTALYREVGRIHGSTGTAVERGIRHVKQKALLRCPAEVIRQTFGNVIDPRTGDLTNGELIARLERMTHEN